MKYGYFDDTAKEYVITDPRTPAKWVNYIGTIRFGGLVDHTGGALLCAGDPALNRILKYIPQLPESEPKGETLYLRIRENGSYKILSPFFTPTLDDYDDFACHVGLGYQRIVSRSHGIRTDVLIFVPNDSPVEIRDIKITNEGNKPVEIDLIPLVEYSHFEALKQFTNADWVPQTMMSEADRDENGLLILKQFPFMRKETKHNFFTSNHPVDSFESDRARFLGNNEYATWQAPEALKKESFSNYEARRGNNIGALLHKLGTLAPGESKRIITQLGQAKAEEVAGLVHRYRDEKNVASAFRELASFWDDYLSKFSCETPDEAFNTTVNVHNPRQCYMTLNWSRYLSLYQLGLGSRGLGFRDSSQDTMGAVAGAPGEVKDLLRKLISVQNPDGSAMHQFFPLSMEATEGDALEEGHKLVYGDDHLWSILAVCAYVKETGDYDFLREKVTFYDKKLPLEKRASAPVLEHLLRALDYTKTHTGMHGLPLLGFADWNDTVNLLGDAESLFNAHLYGKGLLEIMDLLEYLGETAKVTELREDYEVMRKHVNEHAWDGEWFIRYFTEKGEPIGSSSNTEGKIYTNAQSWAVLSGFAEGERVNKALDSVFTHLNTAHGIKLSSPGYTRFDSEIGGVSTYPPGAKENGGIFLHSNPWVMIAETMRGNGDRAYKYYLQINPAAKNDDIDTYEIEPYVYAQNILGDEHPQFGLGRNSWLSGTASWTYQAATQYILGIQPTHQGLRIDPCIPSAWNGFKVRRVFRDATYIIEVDNSENICSGVATVELNGTLLDSNTIPVQEPGSENRVVVTMRKATSNADAPPIARAATVS
ncbi:glycosyl transferase [Puniceicoccales bacterium CK1056]|uniref:Glycosyl transferase n=1 Tax=Oceanipulchritudo coccoides TaxID=2706888 RepID=A0A6B2M4C9_9BACT|nr:glycosyl transferase [Oceanipulchritudo coccoides]NDV63206.1 glycosyl transferase [Oceanipulchritudo coccoides]